MPYVILIDLQLQKKCSIVRNILKTNKSLMINSSKFRMSS